jgi:large repetitive protein
VVVVHASPLALRADASDSYSGVATVRFLLDGATVLASDSTAPYEVTVDVLALSNGVHTISVLAVDAAGNVSAPDPGVGINATPAR